MSLIKDEDEDEDDGEDPALSKVRIWINQKKLFTGIPP